MIGKTISHYRITEKLGEGGMGVVYRAHDSSLNRDVAIKVLPDSFISDPERKARFAREARILATLSAPNIAAIYGLEEVEGKPYLVLELVEGPTLADRLKKGRIPIDETLDICRQIAEGLEAAHEKGIIHRDLKPANVKITPEGKVKILDFGLARAFQEEPEATDVSQSPTITDRMTQTGVILGTAAYMSPEQAKGKAADKRVDLWAFGCILFECLTGKRAFEGDTVAETMAAVLRGEPAWDGLPSTVQPRVKELLHHCLQKDAKNRLRDIGDARFALNENGTAFRMDAVPAAWPQSHWRALMPWIIAAVGFTIAALAIWSERSRQEMPEIKSPSSRFSINLPANAPLAPTGAMPLCVGQPSLALSPDGRYLVYVALVNGTTELYRRDMATGEFKGLPGTQGAHGPFFSPDSHWVAFFAGEKLKKIPIAGGEPTIVASAYSIDHGGTWGSDNSIYYNPEEWGSIRRISAENNAEGGKAQVIYPGEFPIKYQGYPSELPGGKALLANVWALPFVTGIIRKDGGGEPKMLPINGGFYAQYVPTGHLLYATPGKLMAARYDWRNEKIVGQPEKILDGLQTELLGSAQYSVSAGGTLVYARGVHAPQGFFTWVDRKGTKSPVPNLPTEHFGEFVLSPDGRKLALTRDAVEGMDVWIYDFVRSGMQRFTFGGTHRPGIWADGGKSLVFFRLELQATPQPFWKAIDGAQDAKPLPEELRAFPFGLLPGEKDLLLGIYNSILIASFPESGKDQPGGFKLKQRISHPKHGQTFVDWLFVAISPDGRWLAYTSMESGRWEIWICSFPDFSRRTQVSTNGGEEPRWNPNGREVVFRWGSQWFSVNLALGSEVHSDPPKLLFEGPYVNVLGYDWDISPDGSRFLVIENPQQNVPQTELEVITNLHQLLREKLPPE